jgi:hypothetical protein
MFSVQEENIPEINVPTKGLFRVPEDAELYWITQV